MALFTHVGGVAIMKKKIVTFLLGSSLVLGLAACGGGSDSGSGSDGGKDTASAGEKIYNQKCSSCHGGDLKGGVGPDLTKVGAKYKKAEILDIINKGKNGSIGSMPAGLAAGDEADQVAEWLAAKK